MRICGPLSIHMAKTAPLAMANSMMATAMIAKRGRAEGWADWVIR